jgi:hypothetical protein
MRAQIEPGWLVSLMCRWSARQIAGETGALGYPKKACGFSEKTTGGYSHTNPTSFSVDDFTDLNSALTALKTVHEAQFITMMMYYKPWAAKALQSEGWAFGNSTYFKRLHAGHEFVAKKMDAMKKPIAFREKVEYIVTY